LRIGSTQAHSTQSIVQVVRYSAILRLESSPDWSRPASRSAVSNTNSCLVAKGGVIRPLASRFNADLVVHGESEPLLATEVLFCRLDRNVAQQELDLVELAACQMAQTRACPSQIMGRQLICSLYCWADSP